MDADKILLELLEKSMSSNKNLSDLPSIKNHKYLEIVPLKFKVLSVIMAIASVFWVFSDKFIMDQASIFVFKTILEFILKFSILYFIVFDFHA